MSAERNRVLAGELVSRASVEAAANGSLDDALTACDFDLAASIALAQARLGKAVDVGRILPGIEFPPIGSALIAIAGDKKALLDVVVRRAFPRTKDAAEIEAMTLYAAWSAAADKARVIPELRRLAAYKLTAEAYALLSTIAASIDDPNVQAACKPIATFAKEYAKSVTADDKAMNAPIDAVLASLPAAVEASRGGFTVRASGKEVGRNDPCPCGSGLKYKKCHADKPQAAASSPSPIAGVSWDDFLLGDHLTAEHIHELSLKDLVKVDLARLSDPALTTAMRRFETAKQWHHVQRVLDAARNLPPTSPEAHAVHIADAEIRINKLFADDEEERAAALVRIRSAGPANVEDELRRELIHSLFDVDPELAYAEIAKLPSEVDAFHLELEARKGPDAAWRALVAQAHAVVATRDRVPAIELAYSLMRIDPALGILGVRACIGAWLVDDPELLLESVEEARDKLNLPPTDPAWDVYDTLIADDEKQGSRTKVKLDASTADAAARIDQLERTLATVRAELADAKTLPAAGLMRQPSTAGGDPRDKLVEKIRELEALIREGNEERRELRDQLEAAAAAPVEDRHRRLRVVEEDPEEDDGDELEIGSRAVAIPRFERRALDALSDVPATVAAETMRTIGTLAAGDPYAWRNVKAAKDMPRQVLMGRVGIHHRLIFRSEGGSLDVLDLITREQLQTTLKRLRQSR